MKSKQEKLEIWAKHAERLDVVLACGCEAELTAPVHYRKWSERCRQSPAPNLHSEINISIYDKPGLWRSMATAAYGMALRDLGGLPT